MEGGEVGGGDGFVGAGDGVAEVVGEEDEVGEVGDAVAVEVSAGPAGVAGAKWLESWTKSEKLTVPSSLASPRKAAVDVDVVGVVVGFEGVDDVVGDGREGDGIDSGSLNGSGVLDGFVVAEGREAGGVAVIWRVPPLRVRALVVGMVMVSLMLDGPGVRRLKARVVWELVVRLEEGEVAGRG